MAGDAAVGEEVRRVGKDEVDGGFGDGGEDFQAIAVVEAEVVLFVVESGRRKGGHDDQGGSLIKRETESSGGNGLAADSRGFPRITLEKQEKIQHRVHRGRSTEGPEKGRSRGWTRISAN